MRTGTSSPTTSTSRRSESVIIALGSNLGSRLINLRRAIEELKRVIRVVRVSTVRETEPVGAPAGSPRFLNMVIAGHTSLSATALLDELQRIERTLGRVRRGVNAPRVIDLDLILHSAHVIRTSRLTLPHPRYLTREFVMTPLRELDFPWRDPISGARLGR